MGQAISHDDEEFDFAFIDKEIAFTSFFGFSFTNNRALLVDENPVNVNEIIFKLTPDPALPTCWEDWSCRGGGCGGAEEAVKIATP